MSPSLLLLDVDNTLYPPSRGVVERVDALINRYVVEGVVIAAAEVDGIGRRLWSDYGTTLHGLMHRRCIDPADYLRFVHAIELGELLAADPALVVVLGRIPLLKVAVTNGSAAHARGVLDCLGVRSLFFRVYGLERLAFVPKPYVQAYQMVLADLHALGPSARSGARGARRASTWAAARRRSSRPGRSRPCSRPSRAASALPTAPR